MATLRLGTLNSTGDTFTSVIDLSGNTTVSSRTMSIALVRDSFKVSAPDRNQQFSESTSRYGGAIQASETLGNGKVGASLIVNGASATEAVDNWEFILATVEAGDSVQYYLEWTPANASNPVYYEVRGLPTWQANYRWIEFQSNKSLVFEVEWPVAPLARGLSSTFSIGSMTTPGLSSAVTVGGTAPALMDVKIAETNSSYILSENWAMLAWSKTMSSSTMTAPSPFTAVAKPFGILDVQGTGTYDNLQADGSGWSVTRNTSAADSLNSTRANFTVGTAAGSATVQMLIDPSLITPDSFASKTAELECWARIYVPSTRQPTLVGALISESGNVTYTLEYGSTGKAIPSPTSAGWRFVKVGTFCVSTLAKAPYTLEMRANFAAGAAATSYYFDYAMVVPSKARAMNPTGKQLTDSYPAFKGTSTGNSTWKQVNSDLSAVEQAASGSNGTVPSAGLGGQMIEVDPGTVNLLVKLSTAIPDDPDNATADTLSLTRVITGRITPRYYLARGS